MPTKRPAIGLVFKSALLVAGLSLSATAPAKRFCYYWVDNEGNAETFETPPLSLDAPPFADLSSLNGHLVVALAEDSCRRSRFRSSGVAGAAPAQPREAISTPGAEISPGISPDEETPDNP